MPNAYVYRNGTVTLMGRILNDSYEVLTPTNVTSIEYTIFEIDEKNADNLTAVSGHIEESLVVADVFYSSLQTSDERWTADTTGYNFLHTIDISSYAAFTEIGKRYRVNYTITPATGQVVVVPFVVECE